MVVYYITIYPKDGQPSSTKVNAGSYMAALRKVQDRPVTGWDKATVTTKRSMARLKPAKRFKAARTPSYPIRGFEWREYWEWRDYVPFDWGNYFQTRGQKKMKKLWERR